MLEFIQISKVSPYTLQRHSDTNWHTYASQALTNLSVRGNETPLEKSDARPLPTARAAVNTALLSVLHAVLHTRRESPSPLQGSQQGNS